MHVVIERLLSHVHADRGSVIVFVALGLPALIAVFAIALDVGNWFVHKRSLQNQVDAAALAGGDAWYGCFSGATNATAMETEATKYDGGTYNQQIGGAQLSGSQHFLFNSKTFWQGGPGPDDTPPDPCTPDSQGRYVFDVKGTEANVPLILQYMPGLTPLSQLNARARVELRQQLVSSKSLPLAVPDVNPRQVGVTFVDESTGGELTGCSGAALVTGTTCTFLLPTKTASDLNYWSGSGTIVVPSAGQNIGVRVGVGGAVGSCANTTGSSSYVCYDYTALKQGLVLVRGFTTSGSAAQPNTPILRAAWTKSACSGTPFFSDAQLAGASSCGVAVLATVDFGTGSTDPTKPASAGGVSAKLTTTINGTTVPMSYDASTGVWSTSGFPLSVAAGSGPVAASIDWEEQSGSLQLGGGPLTGCTTAANNRCKATFGAVQRVYAASDDSSGPVKFVSLSESSSAAGSPYSLQPGSHTVAVNVGLEPDLTIQPPSQTILLRLTGGSRTSGVNCDGTGNNAFTNAIVNGCQTPYQTNSADICPDTGPLPPPGYPDCVPLKTGNLGSTVATALDTRFDAPNCPANNWGSPSLNVQTDPRAVELMVTDLSALGGNGFGTVPVVTFATFYITGWSNSSCTNNQTWTQAFGTTPEPSGGNIWGHFVFKLDTGPPSISPCKPNAVTPCVPVLTK